MAIASEPFEIESVLVEVRYGYPSGDVEVEHAPTGTVVSAESPRAGVSALLRELEDADAVMHRADLEGMNTRRAESE